MNVIFFDDDLWHSLKPLTFTRPCSELRVGILTIREKWEKLFNTKGSWLTKSYLQEKYPAKTESYNLFINGAALPTATLATQFGSLSNDQVVVQDGRIIAAVKSSVEEWNTIRCATHLEDISKTAPVEPVKVLEAPHHIFGYNFEEIEKDFQLLTSGKVSQPLSTSVSVIGDASKVFLEEGAAVDYAILNTTGGSIYIGKEATVQEGSMLRGPIALCEHAQINMGAKIYGGTTLGPYCKAGGEVNNAVFTGFSSKAHDGFLGNAVLGEWCNLGADTNNSNLKNNYEDVKMWSYKTRRFEDTGLQFAGLIMGDHTKTGINTMFNTGTVTGVCSNVFGPGFPRTFVPSFVQGGPQGYRTIILKAAFRTAELVWQRRGKVFDDVEKRILEHVYEENERNRKVD